MKSDIARPVIIILLIIDASFIKLDMKVASSVLEEIISEMPDLIIPERKGIVDYINIEHYYYKICKKILKRLRKEFINILNLQYFIGDRFF